jgi:hypothetical protein
MQIAEVAWGLPSDGAPDQLFSEGALSHGGADGSGKSAALRSGKSAASNRKEAAG